MFFVFATFTLHSSPVIVGPPVDWSNPSIGVVDASRKRTDGFVGGNP